MTTIEATTELQMMQLKYVNDDGSSRFDVDEVEAMQTAIKMLGQPEIIWCADCEHWVNSESSVIRYCDALNCYQTRNFYCKYGKRREA